MGAATALMIGSNRKDIDFILSDSPYVDVKVLC